MENILKTKIKVFLLPLINISFFIVMSSFGQMLLMSIGASFLISLVFLIIYMINLKKIPKKLNIIFLILLAYTIVMTLISKDFYYWIISLGTVAAFSSLLALNMTEEEWKGSFTLNAVFSLGVLLLYDYGLALTNWNPNSISFMSLLGMLTSIVSFKLENNKKTKIMLFALIIIEIIALYLTESRTSLLIFLIAVLTSTVFTRIFKSKLVHSVYAFSCLMISAVASQYKFILDLNIVKDILKLSKTMFGKGTLFSDREPIWDICSYLIGDNWFFGTGSSLYEHMYSHNMFYSIQYTYGIIGFLLYVVFLYFVVKYVKNDDKNIIGNTLCLIFLAIMVGQVTENYMFTSNLSIFLPYVYLSISIATTKRGMKNEKTDSIHTDI